MNLAAVTELFVLSEHRLIYAHLSSFDWDFKNVGEVTVSRGRASFRARQVGSGNHEGRAVVVLRPIESWDEAAAIVREIHEISGEPIVIKRRG